jgi:hypothetical protein
MFLRLFILALLVYADLPVGAPPIRNSDQNRMEETRKEHEEALKTYRELAQKDPETCSNRYARLNGVVVAVAILFPILRH